MIDFQNAKSIFTPKGEVMSIARNGEVLWQKVVKPQYTELEYIESTGTQYIDIGTTIDTATDEIELKFQLTETSNYKWFFGEYDTNARLGLGSGDGANKRNFLYKSNATKVADTDMYNNPHIYSINAYGGFIDGVKKVSYTSFASTSTLYLFNINIDSTADYKCKAKIWAYKQTRNGVLIRDLVPVLDINGIPCMYDQVTERFFYNAGTGQFLYGEKPTTPYKTELEYLESTGTQYIDTSKYAPLNTDIEVKFKISDLTNGAIFGGRTAQTAQTCTLFYLATGKPPYFRFDRNGQKTVANNNQVGVNTEDILEFVYKNDVATVTNLTTNEKNNIEIGMPNSFSSSPISLFGVNTNGTVGTFLKGKIYEWKYWENGKLLQHFIPVLDYDNKPCMYDKVSGELLYNQGTGEFLYG